MMNRLQLDTPIPFFSFPAITQEQLRSYSQASGDFNPIHLDEEVAKQVGLPGIIAHGMYIAALASNRAIEFVEKESGLPVNSYELYQYQTRFKAMTFVGDIPSVGGLVKQVGESEFTLELVVKNNRGELVLTGNAKFRRASR